MTDAPAGTDAQRSAAPAIALVAIFFLALGLRLAHVYFIEKQEFLRAPNINPDAAYSHDWAMQAVGKPWPSAAHPYYVPPLYMECLRGLYALAGPSPLPARLIQSFLGALSPILIYWIARRLRGRREAIMAALLAALYPVIIFYEATLTKESILMFLACLALVSILVAASRDDRRGLRWLAAGMATGLLCLTRPNLLMFVVVVAVIIIWGDGRRTPSRRRMDALGWIAGAALAVSPATVRNRLVAGDPVTVNSNGGFTFYVGNRPGSDAFYVGVPGVPGRIIGEAAKTKSLAEKSLGRELKDSEVSRFFLRQGLAAIRQDPMAFVRRAWHKFLLTANAVEVPHGDNYYFARQYSWVLRLPLPGFGFLLPWAILGAWTCRRGGPAAAVLNGFGLCVMVSLLLFYVSDRYRLPLAPLVIVYGAVGLGWMWDAVRSRRADLIAWAAALLACGYALAFFPLVNHLRTNFSIPLVNIATRYLSEKRPHDALPYLKRIQDSGWRSAEASEALGWCYLDLGEYDLAVEYLDRAIAESATRYESYFYRGVVYFLREMHARAAVDFKQVLQFNDGVAEAHYYLGAICHRQHQLAEAAASLERALRLDPTIIPVYGELTQVYRESGKPQEAQRIIQLELARTQGGPGLLPGQ